MDFSGMRINNVADVQQTTRHRKRAMPAKQLTLKEYEGSCTPIPGISK
jgi:hypothetical protein